MLSPRLAVSHSPALCSARGRSGRWRGLFSPAVLIAGGLALAAFHFHGATTTLAQQPAEAELACLRPSEGMKVSLFAAEPDVINPAAIDIDTHGRVWVAEIVNYRNREKTDRIKVLEDTDGDGRADRVTIFAEGVFCPMSICVAGPYVYVATSPDLWVYEDLDGDLRADGPPRKLLTGFGGHNHDHGAHSLVLGPDHKWWMAHGDGGFDVTGTDGSQIKYQWGAMLRGELDGSQLEIVAENFRNPYEICISSFGEAFCSDNDNDGLFSTRICWILEGGNYGWFGAPPAKVDASIPFAEGWHFRAHIPGYVPGTLVTGFGSPCGICYYEGDAFGPQLKNVPWHVDAGPRELRAYPHEPRGAGMQATSRVLMTSEGDDYFRPSDVCVAPDGSIYVADWYDGGVGGHAYNNPHQGRIFRLTPTAGELPRIGKPGPYETQEAALTALANPNLATQYLARERLLQDADSDELLSATRAVLQTTEEPNLIARLLWVLDRSGPRGTDVVREYLQAEDTRLRALAVRILRRHGDRYAADLLPLAGDDAGEVRREVLLALPRLEGSAAQEALLALANQYDGQDRYLLETIHVAARPHKGWLFDKLAAGGALSAPRLQLLQVLDPAQTETRLLNEISAPQRDVTEKLAILNLLATSDSPAAATKTLELVGNPATEDRLRRAASEALSTNLSSRWAESFSIDELQQVAEPLLASPPWRHIGLSLIAQQRLTGLTPQVLSLLTTPETDAATRLLAMNTLTELNLDSTAVDVLQQQLAHPEQSVQQGAIRALLQAQAWPQLRQLFTTDTPETSLQTEAITQLMQGTDGALVLLRLLDEHQLTEPLQDMVLARASDHPDANVRVLFERFMPEELRPARLGAALKPEAILTLTGDPHRGERIFMESSAAQCKKCHVVAGIGGTLGPDLSQIGRKYERATLLETILEPSKAIGPEYVPYLVETTRGHVYIGFLIEQSEQRVVLKDADGKLIELAAAEVEILQPQEKSLMPELLLAEVTAQDAADLLEYLTSLKQSVQHVGQFRLMGPFDAEQGGLNRVHPPEEHPAEPNLTARHLGLDGAELAWELVSATPHTAPQSERIFPGVSISRAAQSRGLRGTEVTYYAVITIESDAPQAATLLIGSDDDCQLWLNGSSVHRHVGSRALHWGADRIPVQLNAGRNTLLMKVVNHAGEGGLSLSIESPRPVQLRTE